MDVNQLGISTTVTSFWRVSFLLCLGRGKRLDEQFSTVAKYCDDVWSCDCLIGTAQIVEVRTERQHRVAHLYEFNSLSDVI